MAEAIFDLNYSISYLEHLYPTGRWHVLLRKSLFGMAPELPSTPYGWLDFNLCVQESDLKALAALVAKGQVSNEELDQRGAEFLLMIDKEIEARLDKEEDNRGADVTEEAADVIAESEDGLSEENETALWEMVDGQCEIAEALNAIKVMVTDLAVQQKMSAGDAERVAKMLERYSAKAKGMAQELDRVTREIFYGRGEPDLSQFEELEALIQDLVRAR